MKWKTVYVVACLATLSSVVVNPICARGAVQAFQTQYARIGIDEKGFITSLVSLKSGEEYSPAGHPSPVMSLHEYGKPYDQLIPPTSAEFNAADREFSLTYPNGAVAVIKSAVKDDYFRFQLVSLEPRGAVDNVIWGPLHTSIHGKMGDLIGVVRNPDWAIGMFGLDDNTISGPPVDGDCYAMGYYIHSTEPDKHPVPSEYHEGQWFRVGGNGVSDSLFSSHREDYFHMVFGTGAKVEPEFGSTIAYHSRDRSKVYTNYWTLMPGFELSRPRHQISDSLPGVDFIGSSVALYACPDTRGLHVIESIVLAEGLPYNTIGGRWIHEPGAYKPGIAWSGPHDRLIEYADALGIDGCRCEDWGQGEYYANPPDHWSGKRVEFADRPNKTYKKFTDECNKHGIKYGLHNLCMFLQAKRCTDVSPVANEHLQTVCRTHLAKDISETDTNIIVTDRSYLGEKGTWTDGDRGNHVRIGGEIISFDGITESSPYTLIGVKRGFASTAATHRAGDEVAKLLHNCYDGFCPDMTLMLDYADYYAHVMVENGMRYIDFDGLESTIYMNQGYYGVRTFFRRFFGTYGKLTGGEQPVVGGSCIWPGGWLYMASFGGMFDPIKNQWDIQGKDLASSYGSSYTPNDLGIVNWHTEWSVYDAENLEAKSIGGDRTYTLGMNQRAVEMTGEKKEIFKAFHTWESARDQKVFTPEIKEQLNDLGLKFHLEQTNENCFVLYPIKEARFSGQATSNTAPITVSNPYDSQPLQMALRMLEPATDVIVTLPDGSQIKSDHEINTNQFIICKGNQAYHANRFRRKTADLEVNHAVTFPTGGAQVGIQCAGTNKPRFELTMWFSGKGEAITINNRD